MIIIDRNTRSILMNKIDRCKLDRSHVYQLILQHTSTRDLIIYKVRDYAAHNPIYFNFTFSIPDYMEYGEYKVYLIRNSDWYPEEIDIVSIQDSERITDKKPTSINGYYIISGDTIMMTKAQKKILSDAYGYVQTDGDGLTVNYQGYDERAKGNISESIEIIHTDILRFMQPISFGSEPVKTRNKQHIEYKRHER